MSATAVAIREPSQDYPRPKESALAALWRNAHALSEGLVTEDGRRFRVVYPGRQSGRAGPDFVDSLLETESGDLLAGDVELHLDAPGWERHGHHTDPNYNGVILHVVLHPRGRTASPQQSRTGVVVASLTPALGQLEHLAKLPAAGADSVLGLDLKERGALLDHAGDQRFQAKSSGFAIELRKGDPEETVYCAIMEALGYSANRRPFRELASAVPMSSLRALRDEPAATWLIAIEAMLVQASGLLDHVRPRDHALRLRALLKDLPRPSTRPVSAQRWRLFRVRLANHPVKRLAGAARLVDRYIESGLVQGLAEDVRRGDAGHLVRRLTVPPFIGQGRAREMAVSVVLPFVHAWSGVWTDRSLGRECLRTYAGFPGLQENDITREMRRVLSSEGGPLQATGARRHQGLMHLYMVMTGRIAP